MCLEGGVLGLRRSIKKLFQKVNAKMLTVIFLLTDACLCSATSPPNSLQRFVDKHEVQK